MSAAEFANVNGLVVPLDRAVVPVADHGFLYGDSVYETIRTYRQRPFQVREHLERLARSAAALRLPAPCDSGRIAAEIEATLAPARQGYGGEFALRVMITRGSGPLGYDPDLTPRSGLVILARHLRPLGPQDREAGIAAIVAKVRRNPISALDPRIKSSNLLNVILAAHEAKDAGAAEAILLNHQGDVAEGTQTNVFFVRGGRLQTPSVECGILGGLTRETILELAREAGLFCDEGRYPVESLGQASEIFVSSTTREVLPVSRLDGRPVGAGRRGPVARDLQARFESRVERILGPAPPATSG